MSTPRHTLSALLPLASLCVALAAQARPVERFASDTVDDATLTLGILDEAIDGDVRSHCTLRIVVVGTERPFSNGDRIFLWVYEDDLAGDETLWRTDFAITAAELNAQRVDRTLDCSSNFGDDVGGHLEIYGDARVEKDSCGLGCRWDRPTTANIDVLEVQDDAAEEDDGRAAARMLPLGVTAGRIARDQDWFTLQLPDPASVVVQARHRPTAGRLEVELYDGGGAPIGRGADGPDTTRLESMPLPAGQYSVRVQPRDGADYNFYDVELRVETQLCAPGAVQREPCERCGQRESVCGADGRFGPPGECMGVGECEAGTTREVACGDCGTAVETCDAACVWLPAACMNEGECEPGAEEVRDCDGGAQVRQCGPGCVWSDFGVCTPNACADGDERECYDGPAGTAGVGVCRLGGQRCVNGVWASCQGAVVPAMEQCGDGDDNDCNGVADCFDPVCEGVPDCGCTPQPEQCLNGEDDDCDTIADCNDPDCIGTPECGCAPSEAGLCVNGFDDDCDGAIDCSDPDCLSDPACVCAGMDEQCDDGMDDDCDLLIDCADPDCDGVFPCTCLGPPAPESCSNGIDDDCDDDVDCADSDCILSPACAMCMPEICGNGEDEDC
ncbi:MAG: hypothetical protein KC549_16725, partial [Myxococcales bacterium]|nr:hypothetical protein [Myxococcales bacterium]